MVISYRRGVLISLIVLLAACESDEAKLQRLQGAAVTLCLNAQARREALSTTPGAPRPPGYDSLLREWGEYDAKCKLAEREFNRFMR